MNERLCHMDNEPCSNNPIHDNQQSCRYWWNPIVIKKCEEIAKEKALNEPK